MTKTIVEAYKNKFKQMIILISGFSGSGKTVLGKSLSKDLKINFVNLNDYYKEDWDKTSEAIELEERKIVDWDSPDAVDWNKFNEEINRIKEDGVVVSGFSFPKDSLSFKTDLHIHLKISKDDLIKNRKDYKSENEDSRINSLSEEMEKRILNKITYPHYMNSLQTSIINKFIQVKSGEEALKEAYGIIFDFVVENIEKKIY